MYSLNLFINIIIYLLNYLFHSAHSSDHSEAYMSTQNLHAYTQMHEIL